MTRLTRAAFAALALLPCALARAQTAPPAPPAAAPPAAVPAADSASAAAAGRSAPPAQTQLQKVVVTGRGVGDEAQRALAAEQAATPGAVTLVDGESLRQRSVATLTDMLRYVPGVWAASGVTGDGSFLSSRGSNLDATNYDGNGIKLLQDGLPVTAADGNNHNRDVDPLSARHIVVARGANALAYGASTLGGAIDFISPTARDGAPNEVLLGAGRFGERQARATVGAVAGDVDGLVSVEGRRSDGYREHLRQRRMGLHANAGWQLGAGASTRFYASAIDNDQQLPGALTRAEFAADPRRAQAAALAGDYQYNVRTARLANKTRWDLGDGASVSAGLSYEVQRLEHPIVYAPPFFSLLIDTEQRNLGGMLRYQRRLGAHELLAGLNVGTTTVTGGNFAYVPGGARTLSTRVDNAADNTEAFVLDRWQFAPGWTAVYGAQAVSGSRRIRNTDAASGALRDPTGRYDSLNPRVGLIRQLTPDSQLFANLSRLYEAPTLYELEDDVRGNQATLDAMHGTVLELGTRGSEAVGRHRVRWDLAVYHAWLRDEILSRDDPKAPGTSLSANVGRTVHAGVEALLGASLALGDDGQHRVEPLLSLTLNDFRFRGDPGYGNNRLPAAPRHALKGELLYRHASGFYAGPTFDVVGHRWADFANTYGVEGYRLWGLRAGFVAAGWEVYVEGRNLGDKATVSLFSVQDRAAPTAAILTPGAPRSLQAGLRLKF